MQNKHLAGRIENEETVAIAVDVTDKSSDGETYNSYCP